MNIKKFAAVCLAGALAVSTLAGCGVDKNATVATMENVEVKLGIANFLSRYQQASSDESFRAYFGNDVWSQDLYGNGSTMQETMKDQVMESLHTLYTLKQHMADYNVSITTEDENEIAKAAVKFMTGNSEGTLKELGATEDIVKEVLTLFTIQSRVQKAIMDQADTNVSDEDANMRAYTMVKFDIKGYYDDSYNFISYTEKEIAEIKEKAQKLEEDVTDPADLEKLAKDAGYTATTGTYDKANTSLNKDVKAELDKLSEGGLSKLISTEDALYMVRLDKETDEEATKKNRETIISQRKSEKYQEVLKELQKDDGWEVKKGALTKIQFKNAFTTKDPNSTETEKDTTSTEEGTDSTEKDTSSTETETESGSTETEEDTGSTEIGTEAGGGDEE